MRNESKTNRARAGQMASGAAHHTLLDTERAEESVDIGRIQLLLAEKRTALAALRTGIAIFTLPLSVTTVLITTSRYYNFTANLQFLIPLLGVCIVLVAAGTYLIVGSLMRFRRHGEQIGRIKAKDPKWQALVD
jgi:uncharacterized membrane protein YidH (DUF202 family)